MKKTLTAALALLLALLLTACSLNISNLFNTSKDDPAPPPVEEPDPPAPPAEPTEPALPSQSEEPSIPEEEQPSTPDAPQPEEDDSEERVIRVSHEDVTLFSAGETFRFTVWDSNGDDPDTCTYTSADPAIASVDESGGEVTAVAPGTTTITVRAAYGEEEQEFSCIVRCRWEDAEPVLPDDAPAASAPSLQEFFATLQGQYEGLGAMMVMEGELLENYYPGLSSIAAVEEIYLQETMITTANVAVGLVKLSDSASSDDVAAVMDVLNARITTQAEGGAWYPASCETWRQGITTSASNYVGMFVYPSEAQAMADLFTQTFGK